MDLVLVVIFHVVPVKTAEIITNTLQMLSADWYQMCA